MRLCFNCDQPVERGEAREFIGSEVVHDYCSISTDRADKVCPPPCNMVHAGTCEF